MARNKERGLGGVPTGREAMTDTLGGEEKVLANGDGDAGERVGGVGKG